MVELTRSQLDAVKYVSEHFDKHWALSILSNDDEEFLNSELVDLNSLTEDEFIKAYNGDYIVRYEKIPVIVFNSGDIVRLRDKNYVVGDDISLDETKEAYDNRELQKYYPASSSISFEG